MAQSNSSPVSSMRKTSLKLKLVVGAISIGVLLMATQTTLQVQDLKEDLSRKIGDFQSRQTNELARHLDLFIETRLDALSSVASKFPTRQFSDVAALEKALKQETALLSLLEDLYIFDNTGKLIVDWPIKSGRRGLDMSQRDYIQEVLKQKKPWVSAPILGRATREPIVVLSAPILNTKGEPVAILAGVMNLRNSDLNTLLSSKTIGDSGYFYLTTLDRTTIFHPDRSKVMHPINSEGEVPLFDRALKGFEGAGIDLIPGRDQLGLYAFKRLTSSDWLLVSVIPTYDAFATISKIQNQMGSTTLLLILLSIPLLWTFSRRLLLPLSRLADSVHRCAEQLSDSKPIQPMPYEASSKEIETVRSAINALISAHQIAVTDLSLAQQVIRVAKEGILITDQNNRILDVNPAFTEITGYQRDEVLGKNPTILSSGQHDPKFYMDMWQSIQTTGEWRGEIWNRRKNEEIYPEHLSITCIMSDGAISNYVAVMTDVSAIKNHDRELELAANYDELTGLPNQRQIVASLRKTLDDATHGQPRQLAVVILDVDRFKSLNDNLGNQVGDKVLQELAERLATSLRGDDQIARVSGDEFAIILMDVVSQEQVEQILQRLQQKLSMPLHSAQGLSLSVSAGVTLFPSDHASADLLLRHANQAMYVAKRQGKGEIHWYTPEEGKFEAQKQAAIDEVLAGLKDDQFTLYYQPKVNLLTGNLEGLEALIRWHRPGVSQIVSPGQFLNFISNTPHELPLGKWVIRKALSQICEWKRAGMALPVSVNISAYQLLQPSFVLDLAEIYADFPEVQEGDLEIEVLESSAVDDWEQATQVLSACRSLGVKFAIDDFGTGYSSLLQLRRLPVDTLKIDQSFVTNMLIDPDDFAIVESVIHLADTLCKKVIAEGVESEKHAEALAQLGCQYGQGYGIGMPMPANVLGAWLQEWNENGFWKRLDLNPEPPPLFQLSIVESAQNYWNEQLNSAILAKDSHRFPVLDHHESAFGRWSRGIGMKHFSHCQSFALLRETHEAVIRQAKEIQQAFDNDLEEELEGLTSHLEALQHELREQVRALRHEVSRPKALPCLATTKPGVHEIRDDQLSPAQSLIC